MSTPFPSLASQFLIAMPNMRDRRFHQSVLYLCEHNTEGAMGIMINRPLDLKLRNILNDPSVDKEKIGAVTATHVNQPIHFGGPVQQDRGFVLHPPSGTWESSLNVCEHMSMTTSKDIMVEIIHGRGPEETLIAIGYAGWESGQLEEEIKANIWLTAPADNRILFNVPAEQRWQAAAQTSGINISALTLSAGHG